MRFRRSPRLAPLILLASLMACGGSDDGTTPTGPPSQDDDLTPVVGAWVADAVVVSPKSNPSVSRDLVAEDGVTFSFTVAASGDYTATLRAFGQTSTETGTVRLSGSTILFSVRTPVAGTSQGTWSRAGAQLILESDLFLDFNQDGTAEDLSTRFVLSSP